MEGGYPENTYELFQNIYFINERRVILDFLLLDRLNCKEFFGLTVLCKIDNSEAAICKFFFEMILVFDFSFC